MRTTQHANNLWTSLQGEVSVYEFNLESHG
jgi:hypothetical protein